MYSKDDARREVKELFEEGYGFDYVRIFLNDLARGKDITWADVREIMNDIICGELGTFTGFGTIC